MRVIEKPYVKRNVKEERALIPEFAQGLCSNAKPSWVDQNTW